MAVDALLSDVVCVNWCVMPSPDDSWYLCHLIVKVNPHFQVLLIYTNLSFLLVSPRLPQPLLLSPLPMVNIVHIHHHFLSLFSFSTGFLSISNFRLALKKEKKNGKKENNGKIKDAKKKRFLFFFFFTLSFSPHKRLRKYTRSFRKTKKIFFFKIYFTSFFLGVLNFFFL